MGKSHVDKIRKGNALTRPTTTLGYHARPHIDPKGNFMGESREVYNNNSNRSNRNQRIKSSAPHMLVLSNDKGSHRYANLAEKSLYSNERLKKNAYKTQSSTLLMTESGEQ